MPCYRSLGFLKASRSCLQPGQAKFFAEKVRNGLNGASCTQIRSSVQVHICCFRAFGTHTLDDWDLVPRTLELGPMSSWLASMPHSETDFRLHSVCGHSEELGHLPLRSQ